MNKEKEYCQYYGNYVTIEQCDNGEWACDGCSTDCPVECSYCQCD